MSARLPMVQGGWLVEAVGGPFDGSLLYHPFGEDRINVFHFFDPQRTPTVAKMGHSGDANHLGHYTGRGNDLHSHQCVYWEAERSAEEWEEIRRRDARTPEGT